MSKTTVLIVEDEAIVAADLAGKLGLLGFEVVGSVATGEDAVDLACDLKPEVVLMDIQLKGAMDGIEAAEAINRRHCAPVIYLTAHSDAVTLARAKLSGPFGYILKPFEERELSTTIEMALYKHQAEQQLRKAHDELELRVEERTRELKVANAYNRSLIEASLDPLVTIGRDGKITDVNTATETATGYSRNELIGTDLSDYFSEPEKARAGFEKVFAEGMVRDYPLELRHRDGRLASVLYNASVYRDERGEVIGVFAAARDITALKQAESALMELNETLEDRIIERTAQLNSANETLRASRVAALNLMEDAVIARKEAEETSGRLRLEIADRQQAEEALRESESFYSQTLESIPGMVFTTRPDGYCDFQSSQWVEFTGVPMREHLGDGWNRLLHPDDRPRAFEAWCAAVEGRAPYDLEYRVRRHDGEYEWFKVIGRPIRDAVGRIVKWFGVAVNIDAIKRAEEDLANASLRTNLLAETTAKLLASDSPQDVVEELCRRVMEVLDCQAFFNFLVDEEAGRLRLNACAGIPEEEVKRLEWLDYGVAVCGCAARDATRIVAEDIPNTPDPRTELVKSYGIRAYACHPLMVLDRVLGTLSFGARNRPGFTRDDLSLMKTVADHVAIAMDRKEAEKNLRHAREAAESANRAKSLFLANMSHELRTPMTGVLGMLEIVCLGRLDDKQKEAIDTARMSGQSLLMILNDILDLTRIETGKLVIEEKPFAMGECMTGAVDIIVPAARNRGLDLRWSMAEGVPKAVVGDRLRLQQVLMNLVGNAVKFTEKGKVEVSVRSGRETVGGRREITFSVSDTGIGIPPDKKELIFQSFHQADDSHSRQYGGTGLGLAISREIVELMGGAIFCESSVGEGSTFTFTIPMAEACPEAMASLEAAVAVQPEVAPLAGVQAERKRLLIAEDDEVTRKVLGFMLQRSEFDFEFAMNGIQVIEMWEKGDYDLIVMDGQMPGMDGFEATRAIREKEGEKGEHIPIMAMTAHALKEDRDRCLAAGMDAYVSKPIDFKICMEVIRGLLGQGERG